MCICKVGASYDKQGTHVQQGDSDKYLKRKGVAEEIGEGERSRLFCPAGILTSAGGAITVCGCRAADCISTWESPLFSWPELYPPIQQTPVRTSTVTSTAAFSVNPWEVSTHSLPWSPTYPAPAPSPFLLLYLDSVTACLLAH